jgi:hypothetical protein
MSAFFMGLCSKTARKLSALAKIEQLTGRVAGKPVLYNMRAIVGAVVIDLEVEVDCFVLSPRAAEQMADHLRLYARQARAQRAQNERRDMAKPRRPGPERQGR